MCSRGGGRVMIWAVALLLPALLLPGCGLLREGRATNQKHYIKLQLREIREKLLKERPTEEVPLTLYPYDERGNYREQLRQLLQLLPPSAPITGEIALLMGSGEELLKRAGDTLQLINAHLLMGNAVEAGRLLEQGRITDPPSVAMVALARGDTVTAIAQLEQLVRAGSDRGIAVRAARLWHHLVPGEQAPLLFLKKRSGSDWERFTASVLLGEEEPGETAEEQAYISFRQAIEVGDTISLKESATKLLAVQESGWRTKALLQLRPLLYRQQLWVEALAVQKALPSGCQADYPYSLLTAYQKEIGVLQSYRQPPSEVLYNAIGAVGAVGAAEETFRSQWGNVENVDNWAMKVVNGGFRPLQEGVVRPGYEEYEAALRHLGEVLPLH